MKTRKLSKEETAALRDRPERPSERAMRLASMTPEWKSAKEAAKKNRGVPKRELKYREFATQRNRLAAAVARNKKRTKEFEDQLTACEAAIRQSIVDDKLESVRVRGYNFTPSHREIAEIYDRDEYLEYACLPENRDLLHKRISMEAAQERWSAKLVIPGVRPGKLPTLSVQKARVLK